MPWLRKDSSGSQGGLLLLYFAHFPPLRAWDAEVDLTSGRGSSLSVFLCHVYIGLLPGCLPRLCNFSGGCSCPPPTPFVCSTRSCVPLFFFTFSACGVECLEVVLLLDERPLICMMMAGPKHLSCKPGSSLLTFFFCSLGFSLFHFLGLRSGWLGG
eukprot:RCo052820